MKPPAAGPAGATLMEVLVSMMIMAIGIISLATLFPMAVMHTVKAHQLTVGTNHRFNAEAMVEVRPELVHMPGAFDNIANDPDFRDEFHYFGRNYLVDPLGIANGLPPNRLDPADQSTMWRFSGIDPNRMDPNDQRPLEVQYQQLADFLATSPDSWIDLYGSSATWDPNAPSEVVVNGFTQSGVIIPDPPNPNEPGRPRYPNYRAVVTYPDPISGRLDAQWRQIVGANGDTITLSAPLAVVSGMSLETATIQTQERRFTWMLTVRKDRAGVANVDVTVFFNRSFESTDEVVTQTADFQRGRSIVNVTWDANGPAPFLKRGSYVLDAQNGYWYQIVDFTEDANSANVILATPARASVVRNTNGRAAFFRGIVDVYSLGAK